VTDFLSGANMIAALTVALFFFRFWRRSRDRLFVLFALAFAVLGVNRLLLFFLDDEGDVYVYASRAGAFALIIAAVIDKNRAGTPSGA
jgi:uncharacterized membrane protein HdeD (DUF308 family)